MREKNKGEMERKRGRETTGERERREIKGGMERKSDKVKDRPRERAGGFEKNRVGKILRVIKGELKAVGRT